MLTIYIDKIDLPVEHDIEKLFAKTRIADTPINRKIIETIEQGEYNDEHSFIDRFKYKLYNSELSTGCKAALCVANNPDKIIDTIECGNNARDAIINFCTKGNIIYYDNCITISHMKGQSTIDVKLDGYRFTTVSRLNDYIQDERPFSPDIETEGIECLD